MNPYLEDLRKRIVEVLSRGATKSEAARSFGVSRSSVKRYAKLAEEGRPLAPKKRPGSKPNMDERARRLLEADMEERPSARKKNRPSALSSPARCTPAPGVREPDAIQRFQSHGASPHSSV
jgi:transposase